MSSKPGRTSYPRPPSSAPTSSSTDPIVAPPPVLPYLRAPSFSGSSPRIPRLPARPPLDPLPAGWTRTQHIVPAAYPRRFAGCFGELERESKPLELEPARSDETREERLARNEGEARECIRMRFDAEADPPAQRRDGDVGGKSWGNGEGLYMAAERWVRERRNNAGPRRADGEEEEGVTLVVTHANGFSKESWHPTLRRLIKSAHSTPSEPFGALSSSSSSSPTGAFAAAQIDEIWLFDDVHHAASIDLNAGRIGAVHGWSDGGRDIANFLMQVYRGRNESYADKQVLPWIEQQSESSSSKRRKIIGVGHSFGGNALVQAAADHPELFSALFLVEPMCPAHAPPRSTLRPDLLAKAWPLVMGATKRRTSWPSLDEAAKVRSSPFFAKWHEEVWALYLKTGLVPLGSKGEVQLATPSWAEAAVFAEPTGIAEGWDKLPRLDMPVGFLMAGDNRSTMGDDMTARMVWRPKRSSNERIMDGGHLLVHEKPDEVADALHRFLGGIASEVAESAGNAALGIELEHRAKL